MANNSRQGQQFQPSSGQGPQKNVEQRANQVSEKVAQQAQSTFDDARSKVTQQLGAVSQAFKTAADKLEQQQQTGLSRRVQQYVRKAEDASNYLQDKSPRELKDDLDRFARQRPAWFLGGAFLAGVLGARFLKSSEKQNDGQSLKGSVEYARA
jgi:hypothetical protein